VVYRYDKVKVLIEEESLQEVEVSPKGRRGPEKLPETPKSLASRLTREDRGG